MKIKKFKEFIKESMDLYGILSEEEVEDQFLRLKEIFNCSIIINLNMEKYFIYVYLPNISPYSVDRQGKLINKHSMEYNKEIFSGNKSKEEIAKELKDIKCRMENMFNVDVIINDTSIEKDLLTISAGLTDEECPFQIIISIKNIKESVGITPNYTTGNSHSYNSANLANARKYVEDLSVKDKNTLFKIANLQSSKKRSWSEWKWDIDKAMDIATQYFANNPESMKDVDDVNMDKMPVKTGYIPYTNNIGGTYTNNISQNLGVNGGSNALGPDIQID